MTTTRRGTKTDPSQPAAMPSTPTAARTISPTTSASTTRTPPYLPTPLEALCLALFPGLLLFGSLFSVINPDTRSAPYDPVSQSHHQDPAVSPNYFARKSNLFNVLFVKRGWAWTLLAFAAFVATHPSLAQPRRRARAAVRAGAVTACWFFMTQWCFGPAVIDRGFRWTGGRCELAEREVEMGGGEAGVGEVVTSIACKAAGGRWKGGHDISGHVFLLVLGTAFLMQEVGWPLLRWTGWVREQRCVVMPDGALKSATVESESRNGETPNQDLSTALGLGGKFAAVIVGLSLWMLLMTAIYFHTWFEKLTGLLSAFAGFYVVYIVPRFVPGIRQVVGLPGI